MNTSSLLTFRTFRTHDKIKAKATRGNRFRPISAKMGEDPKGKQLWNDAQDKSEKLVKKLDTLSRPIGEELFETAKSDVELLSKWLEELRSRHDGTSVEVEVVEPGSDRREWFKPDSEAK